LRRVADPEPATDVETRRQGGKITVLDDNRPHISFPNRIKLKDRINLPSDSQRRVVLEPQSSNPYELFYACLLIPRFSSHLLKGDLAESLHHWMPTICVSFAWGLDHLAIRPEYLQWVVKVPPQTAPSHCIRTVRQNTSKLIFEDFPHFKQENFSNEFWAPSYLVLVGRVPHPAEMINQYIQLTRQQQGIPQHRSG
jgi:REP element-mobilizing transposase RayT